MNKYCVIGKGFIFDRHRQAIERTGGEIILTCDLDRSKKPDYTFWPEMMDSEKFKEADIVVILTPNHIHVDIVREAIKRGKKVICEKPLTIYDDYEGLEEVNNVLQLRFHPEVLEAKSSLEDTNYIKVNAKMYRDNVYWTHWQGNPSKSGGLLYSLGIHYIDLLIFLLGKPLGILFQELNLREARGKIKFEKGIGNYHIKVVDDRKYQARNLFFNNREINLSNRDNLSYEDLHIKVYEDILNGGGIKLKDVKETLMLINKLTYG